MKELLSLLKRFFGYTSFRPLQAEIIQRTLQKEDSLVLMPTGGGKSICFQLPAIYMPGTAIVVSPLIALMKDQVEGLIANGIPAATLNSMMPEEERHRVRQLCIQGKVKLLYISPEGIISELHWLLPRIDISLIAIDEAHCISHWGHDFRPEYTQLSVLKENFPKVPIIALTATADKITRTDILNQLKLRDPKTFISSFDRPNLSLTIRRGLSKKEKIAAIVHFINRHHRQSGIIYCMSRNSTESLVEELSEYSIRAVAYHAGLSSDKREKAQDDFINDRVNVVCATVAFGMGIDKSNVRWVIHYNRPCRTGRNEKRHASVLFRGRHPAPSPFCRGKRTERRQFTEVEPDAQVLRGRHLPASYLAELFRRRNGQGLRELRRLQEPSPTFRREHLGTESPERYFSYRANSQYAPANRYTPGSRKG